MPPDRKKTWDRQKAGEDFYKRMEKKHGKKTAEKIREFDKNAQAHFDRVNRNGSK